MNYREWQTTRKMFAELLLHHEMNAIQAQEAGIAGPELDEAFEVFDLEDATLDELVVIVDQINDWMVDEFAGDQQ